MQTKQHVELCTINPLSFHLLFSVRYKVNLASHD